MSNFSPETEALLRRLFKRGNPAMLLFWRLGLGSLINLWPTGTGRILVLGHTGRKSGLRRLTPLNYAPVDGAIYLAAGFGAVSDWYRNLKAHPAAELWLPEGRWDGVAEELADDDPRRLELMRAVLRASGFVAPLAGVDPGRLGDNALAAATATYRLIRIRPTGRRQGPGGPGELAWVWPALSAAALSAAYAGWLRERPRR
jgi:deazaflavin-dependent oxidoreductase (nitroreductase family)